MTTVRRLWPILLAAAIVLSGCRSGPGSNVAAPGDKSPQAPAGESAAALVAVKDAPVVGLGQEATFQGAKVKVDMVGAHEYIEGRAGSFALKVTVKNESTEDLTLNPAENLWVVSEDGLDKPETWVGLRDPKQCQPLRCLRLFDLELLEPYGWKPEQVLPASVGPTLYGTELGSFPTLVPAGKEATGYVAVDMGLDLNQKEAPALDLVFGDWSEKKAAFRVRVGTPQELVKKIGEIGVSLAELMEADKKAAEKR
ncbi:hypothetical protein [Thermaerobacter litoralis]